MGTGKFSPVFVIGQIRIGTVEGASCVNLGNNRPTGFESHKKHNQGFGQVNGDHNRLPDSHAFLQDSDLIDMISTNDETIPEWVKTLSTPFPSRPSTPASDQ